LFLSTTGEEGFLRGSEYYAGHPLVPPGKTALALNYDAFFPVGRTKDVVPLGAERTTAWPVVKHAAKQLGLEIKPDPRPEQGSYFRTDHFPLAQIGIPAFSIRQGTDFIGKPPGFADQYFKEFVTEHYHQPSDEYHEDWDFSGLEDLGRLGLLIGIETANLDQLPTWNAGDEYLPARERSASKK
jgi:Zn-dependent M28 family amino/carboxypeptidase